jgi:hypothetical protein
MTQGAADHRLDYTDPETGKAYRVAYDFYTDPDTIVIAWAECEGRRVRLLRDLKRRMERAALAAFRAEMAEHWKRLDRAAPTK